MLSTGFGYALVSRVRPVKPWYRVETYERMKITGFTQVVHGSVRLLSLFPEPSTDVIVSWSSVAPQHRVILSLGVGHHIVANHALRCSCRDHIGAARISFYR